MSAAFGGVAVVNAAGRATHRGRLCVVRPAALTTAAGPTEFRTPALWGLRFRRPLLHDGTASTIEEAIGRHRQEADLARAGFERLSPADRAAVIAFLKSL